MIRPLAVLATLLVVTSQSLAQPAVPVADTRRITVTGTADIALPPDRATLRVGVLAEGRTAAEALTRMGRDAGALFDTLEAAGIPAAEIRTAAIDLRDIRDPNARPEPGRVPRIVGFAAETQVTVVSDDLSGLGVLLDDLVRAGANRIDGITFGLADADAALAALRADAVRDAMGRAAAYAAAAGVTLGPVVTISDVPGGEPGPVSRMLAAEAGVPIAAGSLHLSTQVEMTFAISD